MVATNDMDNYRVKPEAFTAAVGTFKYEPAEYNPYKTMRKFICIGAKVGWCLVPSFAGFVLRKGHYHFNRYSKLKRN